MSLRLFPFLALGAVLAMPAAASAETIGGNPGPAHNYVCPHADGRPALDCYLDAVQHLYTMCRNVKSIEIIEFGYDKSTEGTNGAKSDSCLEKQKQNIAPHYKAALKEAGKYKHAVDELRVLHEAWLTALTGLAWHAGETDVDYKTRVARPYEEFTQRIAMIRTSIADVDAKVAEQKAAKAARSKKTAEAPAKAKRPPPKAAEKTATATKPVREAKAAAAAQASDAKRGHETKAKTPAQASDAKPMQDPKATAASHATDSKPPQDAKASRN